VSDLTESHLPKQGHEAPDLVAWRATYTYRKFTLRDDLVLAADRAAGIVARRYVTKPNVMRQAAEEGNTFAYEHRDTRDDEAVNQSGAQELLNRNAAVDVDVVGATGSELRNDLFGWSGHLFDSASAVRGQVSEATTQGSIAQHHHALVSIGPRCERKNDLKGVSAHHDCIDAG
jgi:hypothetical protein